MGMEVKKMDENKKPSEKPDGYIKKYPLSLIIPSKNDTKSEKTRKIALISAIFAGIAAITAVFIIGFGKDNTVDPIENKKPEPPATETTESTTASETPPETEPEPVYNAVPGEQWADYLAINDEIVGWIKIGDTYVDYPVLQSLEYGEDGNLVGNNSYYLNHNYKKEKKFNGAIFADWHVPIKSSRLPNNTILYGHNIAEDTGDGKYFAYVSHYYPQYYGMGAYNNNPTVTFESIYDSERTTYKIFAGMFVNTLSKHGEVFNYHHMNTLGDEKTFYDFIGEVMDRSTFYTDVDLEYGDEILTLSTCYYPLGNDANTRFVLYARRVRPGEDESVDAGAAYINADPKYFDYWYKVNGGSWKGRKWDTSKVKGLDEFYAHN